MVTTPTPNLKQNGREEKAKPQAAWSRRHDVSLLSLGRVPHCGPQVAVRRDEAMRAQHAAPHRRLKRLLADRTGAPRPRAVRPVMQASPPIDFESALSRLSHAPASVGYESPHDSHGAPRGRREAIAYLSVPSTAASTRTRSRRRSSSISRSSSFTDCSSSTRTTASFGTALHGSSP